jgi:hypothetical protein
MEGSLKNYIKTNTMLILKSKYISVTKHPNDKKESNYLTILNIKKNFTFRKIVI